MTILMNGGEYHADEGNAECEDDEVEDEDDWDLRPSQDDKDGEDF